MALFLARALTGGAGIPEFGTVGAEAYSCTAYNGVSLFSDVTPTSSICRAVHYLAAQNVTTGCAPETFCPNGSVDRETMAAFVARALVAPAGGAAVPETYGPDAVTGRSYSCAAASPSLHFTDVPATDPFCKHVHYLWAKGIGGGCGATTFCPAPGVTRGEMAKFLANAFVPVP
jgi:hypothetical protein